jgi:hypothetical protein
MRPNQPSFAREDWREATAGEKAAAWSNYFGYFGTYTIDEQAGTVVHHIEGSWFPNLMGTDQIRHFRFEEERIVLDADTEWGAGTDRVGEDIRARRRYQAELACGAVCKPLTFVVSTICKLN